MRCVSKILAPLLLVLAGAADVPHPEILFSVARSHRLIEGIASDGHDIWLSDVLGRAILTWRDGDLRETKVPLGNLVPLGIAWDPRRQWLWIAADCPTLPGVAKCDQGALIALDRRGRERARATGPAPFHPGDVSVGGGEIFISDSGNGAVYVWRGPDEPLRPIIPAGVGGSAQGSVRDGGHLIVADYSKGIVSVDLATGLQTLLPRADGKPLNGVDGLVCVGDWFIGVRNGLAEAAIVAFRIDGKTITETRVLAQGAPASDPTQLAVEGDRLLLVGEAGWAAIEAGGDFARPTPILSLPISRQIR